MSEKNAVYIGTLPPPYGGVTVKNKLLFEHVFKDAGVEFIDVMEAKKSPLKAPAVLCRLIRGMSHSRTVIFGTGAKWCDRAMLRLRRVLKGRRGLRNDMMIVMGGRYQQFIREDLGLHRLLSEVGSIWVESEQMIAAFRELGLERTYLFPNCRMNDGERLPRPSVPGEKLKLVFFSRICIEKGVEDIIAAYDLLGADAQNVTLDIYGGVENDIRELFQAFIARNDNVTYHGVFDAVNGDVYAELNQYDIMLLMSKREGVAGALVESKMAGITSIVTDRGLNTETVQRGTEGIVIAEPFAENLAAAIRDIMCDRERLAQLKQGAYESRKRYLVDSYRQKMLDVLSGASSKEPRPDDRR